MELDGVRGRGSSEERDCMGKVLRVCEWSTRGISSELMDEAGVASAESDLEVTSLSGTLVDIIYGKSVNVEAWNGDNWGIRRWGL